MRTIHFSTLAVIAGIAFAVASVTNTRLSRQEPNPECPGMKRGAFLRRRYIEVMGGAVVVVLGEVIYSFATTPPVGTYYIAIAVFGVAQVAFHKLDNVVMHRYGHSARAASFEGWWNISNVRSKSESQLRRWTWGFPLTLLLLVGGGSSLAIVLEGKYPSLAVWIPLSILVCSLMVRNRKGVLRIIAEAEAEAGAEAGAEAKHSTDTAQEDRARRARVRKRRV